MGCSTTSLATSAVHGQAVSLPGPGTLLLSLCCPTCLSRATQSLSIPPRTSHASLDSCTISTRGTYSQSPVAPALFLLQLFGSTSRPRLHVPAPAPRPGSTFHVPASRPGPGFTSRPRLHVPAPASRPGPGFTSRPRIHVPAPDSRPGPGFTSRPRIHVPAPDSRPGPGFTSRPRLHVPAPASRPGPGFTSRPRLHVPAPASRPGPGFTCRLHPPGPSYGPPPPSLVLFLGRLGSVP
uniref:Uncharacterized protein n=1 Tax=Knipowitschia caucasica TaxID=637954 RepID=A0AAV2M0M2_KNICA